MDELLINETVIPECDAIERLPYLAPKVLVSSPPKIAQTSGAGADGGCVLFFTHS